MSLFDLLSLALLIAFGFLVAVAFYESLSTRDVLVARVRRLVQRVNGGRLVGALTYLLTVGVGIPLLVVVWTLVLVIGLFLVGSVDLAENVAVVAVSVVAATRVLSYVREKTAHELAKAIPLALLFLLLTGGSFRLEDKLARLEQRPESGLTGELVGFLIALEIGLRLATDTVAAVRRAMRASESAASNEGAEVG